MQSHSLSPLLHRGIKVRSIQKLKGQWKGSFTLTQSCVCISCMSLSSQKGNASPSSIPPIPGNSSLLNEIHVLSQEKANLFVVYKSIKKKKKGQFGFFITVSFCHMVGSWSQKGPKALIYTVSTCPSSTVTKRSDPFGPPETKATPMETIAVTSRTLLSVFLNYNMTSVLYSWKESCS